MTSRRQVLRAAGCITLCLGHLQVAFSAEQSAAIEAANLSDRQMLVLARVVQLLFPHDDLDPDVFRDAVTRLQQHLADSTSRQVVRKGLDKILAEGGWLERDEEYQVRSLKAVDDSDFLRLVRRVSAVSIYSDQRTWALLGYGGDASQFGGYLDRGFDDIDWLPR